MRKTAFREGEFYHIYNRGTDKRDIFMDEDDFGRFLQSMHEFNELEPIGSIFENSLRKAKFGSSISKVSPLVHIVAYCLNPNHYHLLLEQAAPKGIEKFMQRLGTGYTKYFNNKYDRTGNLFQGRFKAIHIESNEYLLHVSAYINLNQQVHQLGSSTSKSSLEEYQGKRKRIVICRPDMVIGQFSTPKEYFAFAEKSVQGTLARRGSLDPALLLE